MPIRDQQNRSFWEEDVWPRRLDALVVGAGLVGLYAAIELKREKPGWHIMLIDRSWGYHGASTKNAGFVCLGSSSELLADLRVQSESECKELLKSRFRGTEYIRSQAKVMDIDFIDEPGFECFTDEQVESWEQCQRELGRLNGLFKEATGLSNQFEIVEVPEGFAHTIGMIKCHYEGRIHPGKWIFQLMQTARQMGIHVVLGQELESYQRGQNGWKCEVGHHEIHSRKMIFATNAYGPVPDPPIDLRVVKNQVYVTEPCDVDLPGTYHCHEGYIYFRKVGRRLLIGGARHIDKSGIIDEMDPKIETYLKHFLQRHLNMGDIKFEKSWIGKLGVGTVKSPIIDQCAPGLYRAVRLGGMGVALGPEVGRQVAKLCLHEH